ncbi:MAG: cysteine desulfurase family protein [Planctomycetota bacterium]|jgi:cysteine desulfurase
MDFIYLDNDATTKPAEEVVAAMTESLVKGWANPSSVHRAGQAVRHQVELARASVCELINCRDRELVFTAGGTEAVNLAVRGSLGADPAGKALVTSRLEHSAVRKLAETLEASGTEVIWLAHDERGLVDLNAFGRLLAEQATELALVSIMWVNNETGVLQPVEEIGRLCREHGVRFHTDATQHVGKMLTDVSVLPIDLLGFSAHKFYGPKGVGGLYIRRGVRIQPQVVGGAQERDRRGGTENVPGIIGLGVAARLAREWLATDELDRLAGLRDSFERRILERAAEAVVNGVGTPRAWHTSNIAFARLEAEAILLMLSERGVCASAGAACSSGSLDPSPVLLAMGVPPELAHGSVRFSLSRTTTDAEIDRALEIIVDVVARLRASLAGV